MQASERKSSEDEDEEPGNLEVTPDEKIEFIDKVKSLSNEQLTKMVSKI